MSVRRNIARRSKTTSTDERLETLARALAVIIAEDGASARRTVLLSELAQAPMLDADVFNDRITFRVRQSTIGAVK